ncbi:MAG: ABC transporter permease subunit [Dehalococcoidia bacterium]|nr:ABC transporter permease subunit [Dehalococcoidia bacterium]
MSTGPSGAFYVLGSDQIGRDLMPRLVQGTRVSMGIAAIAVVFGAVMGTSLALLAGFTRGWTDNVIMRVADIQSAFPSLLLAIFVLYKLGPGIPQLIFLLAITNWVGYTRLLRAQTLSLRNRPFVEAAEALGAAPLRQMGRHILPHLLPLLFMVAVLDFGSVMLAEAGLSFLGLGVQAPSASWGSMIDDGRQFVAAGAWWLFLFPGLALFLAVLAANLTSRWLQGLLGTAFE